MAANVFFLSPKVFDEATIIGSGNWLAAAPATQLQEMQPRKTAQSDGLTGVYVEFDLGAAYAIDTFAGVNGNGTTDAEWRWRGATSQGNLTAAPGYDSTQVSQWPASGKPTDEDWEQHCNLLVSNNVLAFRYWRVDLFDASNPEGFHEYGRLFGGVRWTPTANYTYDWGQRFEAADILEETVYGQTQTEERLRPRGWVLPFDSIRRSELLANAMTLQRLRGRAGPLLACIDYTRDSDLHWHTIYGVLKELGEIGQKVEDRYTARFQIREVL